MSPRSVLVLTTALLFPDHAHALTLTEESVWTDLPIPVCFETASRENRHDRQQIRTSVEQSWEKESAVSFAGWRACRENSKGIRIRVGDDHPQTITRGRNLDGVPDGMLLTKLWGLPSLAANSKSTVHEFGHALGFGHEYARSDAPYQGACALTGTGGSRYIEHDLPITAFDFDSIMVACVEDATRSFSVGVPKLSAGDIYGLVKTYGSALENILDEDEAGDRFGHSIAVGDFNGDATPDLAVGAPGETFEGSDEQRGAVYLYKGDDVRGLRPWGRLTDDQALGFGTVLRAEKLNRDNRADLIVGAADGTISVFKGLSRKPPAPWEGEPPALSIASAAANADISIEPFDVDDASADIGFGHISMLVDLDVDGKDDLIVTAPRALVGGQASGQVFVYRSPETDHPWKQRPDTFTPWYRFGQAY